MDALEEEREATESRFNELLAQLTAHVNAVREAADRSVQLYDGQLAARRRALASVRDGLSEAANEGSVASALAWPDRRGGLRAAANRLVRWLMRDFLEVLDRRGDMHTRRIEELKERVDRLQDTVSAEGASAEALNDALAGTHAALQAALATHREMLSLVNAKDAEVLQRSVAGPLRRMEVLFDEFGRQQEALLSQLVGRRRELDDLVRAVAPAPEERVE